MPDYIPPSDYWGRRPWWNGKVGTGGSNCVLIKRKRKFAVGMAIEFCTLDDVRGMSTGCTPPWKRGIIWKIEGNFLYINYA